MQIFVTLAGYTAEQRKKLNKAKIILEKADAKIARLLKKIAKLRQQGLTRKNRPVKALRKLLTATRQERAKAFAQFKYLRKVGGFTVYDPAKPNKNKAPKRRAAKKKVGVWDQMIRTLKIEDEKRVRKATKNQEIYEAEDEQSEFDDEQIPDWQPHKNVLTKEDIDVLDPDEIDIAIETEEDAVDRAKLINYKRKNAWRWKEAK